MENEKTKTEYHEKIPNPEDMIGRCFEQIAPPLNFSNQIYYKIMAVSPFKNIIPEFTCVAIGYNRPSVYMVNNLIIPQHHLGQEISRATFDKMFKTVLSLME